MGDQFLQCWMSSAFWFMNILISSSGHSGSKNEPLWKKRIASNAGLHEKNKVTSLFVIKIVPRTDIGEVVAHPTWTILNKLIELIFIRVQKDVCSWNIQALILLRNAFPGHQNLYPQETHSTWIAVTEILARRTIWCERTSVVLQWKQDWDFTELQVWKSCIFSANALLEASQTTLVPLKGPHTLLRNQISAWDEKLALRLCASAPVGTGKPSCLSLRAAALPVAAGEGSSGEGVGVPQCSSVIPGGGTET